MNIWKFVKHRNTDSKKDGLQGLNAGAETDDSYRYLNILQWQK